MTLDTILANLAAYSLQLGLLALAGGLAARVFPIQVPRLRLAYFQGLLAAGLLLPWLSPRQALAAPEKGSIAFALSGWQGSAAALDAAQVVVALLGAGVCAGLLRVAVGLARIAAYRRRAAPASELPPELIEVRKFLRVQAAFFWSDDVTGPVAFGVRRPVILLPAAFRAMPLDRQRAVACHELLHVSRGDSAWTVSEEILRSVLWFHPAVHWLLAQIHLAREQTVDGEVVSILGSRSAYLESLIEMGRAARQPRHLAGNLFLKESHLKSRVNLLLKEVAMSKARILVFFSVCAMIVLAAGQLAGRAFPLSAGGEGATPVRVSASSTDKASGESRTPRPNLIHKVEPVYPAAARKEKLVGAVVIELTVATSGEVTEARVVRGHPAFNDAAVSALKQWRYAALEQGPMKLQITVVFRPD